MFRPVQERQGTPASVRESRELLAQARHRPGTVAANEGHAARVLELRRAITERLGHTPSSFRELTPDECAAIWELHPADRVDFWEPAVGAKRQQHDRSAIDNGSYQPTAPRAKRAPKSVEALRRQAEVVARASQRSQFVTTQKKAIAKRNKVIAYARDAAGRTYKFS
jgi:hypothetical protein